jgi:N-acyl-D-aspartate/D-glutamate deacylase
VFNLIKPSYTVNLDTSQLRKTLENISSTLSDGGIGIGLPVGYLPKVNPEEVYNIFQLAAARKETIFSHVRENNMFAIQEVIADAMLTGAALHIVHINSSSLGHIPMSLEMVDAAQKKGYDITTELYPYPAASTLLQSALFDEGWQEKMNISYGDLQWVATGERLTKETFDKYRKSGGVVIIYAMKPEWIKTGIASPVTMIASDGMLYAKLAHPRTAGTFSRVLGKYVREEKVLSLSEAIEKMTLRPAKRLEGVAPSMRFKGRIQVGADADITIFNPETVVDKASFDKGLEFSGGIEYVIVNGTLVIKNGKTVAGIFPGQAVYGKYKN